MSSFDQFFGLPIQSLVLPVSSGYLPCSRLLWSHAHTPLPSLLWSTSFSLHAPPHRSPSLLADSRWCFLYWSCLAHASSRCLVLVRPFRVFHRLCWSLYNDSSRDLHTESSHRPVIFVGALSRACTFLWCCVLFGCHCI